MNRFLLYFSLILFTCLLLFVATTHTQPATAQEDVQLFLPLVADRAEYQLPLEIVATGVFEATHITHAGDDRVFVTDRSGVVWVVQPDGSKSMFLDVRDRVILDFWEQGLLAVAFPPDYAATGHLFVSFVSQGAADPFRLVIERYTVSTTDPDKVDPSSGVEVLSIEYEAQEHNGGKLAFGPDGYLYITVGDDANLDVTQDVDAPEGKILRLDVSTVPYTIPPDNPFVDVPGALDEIWAVGYRNVWGMAFDAQTGDLYSADVGASQREEVNVQPSDSAGGENYGWPCFEGTRVFAERLCDDDAEYTMPVFEYAHEDGRCAVTGGDVYRGTQSTYLFGRYVLADFCTGELFAIWQSESGEWHSERLGTMPVTRVSAIGSRADGEILIGSWSADMRIYRLRYP